MKPTIQIEHPHYVSAAQTGVHCCILIGRSFVSYAIFDPKATVVYRIMHYAFSDKLIGKNDFNTILSDPIFQQSATMHIAIDSLKSTLVPVDFYEQAHAESLFKVVHDLPAGEVLHTQSVPNGIQSLFSLKKPTVSFLSSWRRDIRFLNASTCLLQTYPTLLSGDQQPVVYIWSREDNVNLTLYREGKLLGQHEYTEIDAMELCYHLGHLCAVHAIVQQQLVVYLHGEHEKPEHYLQVLETYFPKIHLCRRPASLHYPDEISRQPSHYFLTLLSMALCAS